MQRIFISTGEVSGDLQGGLLITALQQAAAHRGLDLEIIALGGDRMAAAGAKLLADTTSISAIGILESLPYLFSTQRIQKHAQQYLQAHPPDVAILMDYMGSNLVMGRYLRQTYPDLPIYYYIAPQEWVWTLDGNNTRQIIGFANEILAIFPGEAQYYQQKGANVTWVGHPLLDRLADWPSRTEARQQLGIPDEQQAIALFPASRNQELRYLMPAMMAAAQQVQAQLPTAHFWIPCALERYQSAIAAAIDQYQLRATIVSDSRAVIAAADGAIAKSGTVNLELALQQVPQVVIYRLNPITAWIARKLLKFSVPFVSPPNLVNLEPVVTELLQEDVTPDRITSETLALFEPERRQQILSGYERMRHNLGEPGVCDRVAAIVMGR